MTPVLRGRWQTRFWVLTVIGLPVTLIFSYLYRQDSQEIAITPFVILCYVFSFGLIWDVLYNHLQKYRWDRDWPSVFQLGAGILEGLFLWALIIVWPILNQGASLPGLEDGITVGQFVAHYSIVWVTTYIAANSVMRIVYPRWRYRGGQWLFKW